MVACDELIPSSGVGVLGIGGRDEITERGAAVLGEWRHPQRRGSVHKSSFDRVSIPPEIFDHLSLACATSVIRNSPRS